MRLSKEQIIAISCFVVLLIILASFRTKPKDLLELERTRSLNLQSTNASILIQEASPTLSDNYKTRIQILEAQLNDKSAEGDKADILKQLSSVWYEAGEVGIAGHYAEEVAKVEETAESWGIACTTFALCIKQSVKEKEQQFCLMKSLEAIENAISLDPESIEYQINRAVILAENPPRENPMKGVMLLLDLNKKFPKNVPVINNIAKFALQTNQLDRAEQRLLGALAIEPENVTSNCLMSQLYLRKGDQDKALTYQEKCSQ